MPARRSDSAAACTAFRSTRSRVNRAGSSRDALPRVAQRTNRPPSCPIAQRSGGRCDLMSGDSLSWSTARKQLMSILVDENTQVICQGITGSQGTFHSEQAIAYGTRMVGGVTPGKGGETHHRPAGLQHRPRGRGSDRRQRDRRSTCRRPSPPTRSSRPSTPGCRSIVCITEGIPVLDMMKVKRALEGSPTRLIGPNCPGVITPGECKIGIMPGSHPQARLGRRGLALGHAHLRGGQADHRRGPRPVDLRRHRRRPDQGHRAHRRARDVPGRPRDRSRSS